MFLYIEKEDIEKHTSEILALTSQTIEWGKWEEGEYKLWSYFCMQATGRHISWLLMIEPGS